MCRRLRAPDFFALTEKTCQRAGEIQSTLSVFDLIGGKQSSPFYVSLSLLKYEILLGHSSSSYALYRGISVAAEK